MELSHIHMVLTIAESGSITKAAAKLYLTPVSLMARLNNLELELGFPLFVRSHRGCTPTPAGVRLCEGGKAILQKTDQLIQECASLASAGDYSIRISIYKPYALMALTEQYRRIHPNTYFYYESWESCNTGEMRLWMDSRHLHFVQHGPIPHPERQGLAFLPLWADRYNCFFHHNLPLAIRDTVRLKDLFGYSVFSFSEPSQTIDRIENEMAAAGLQLKRIPFSESAVLRECSAGHVFILEGMAHKLFPHLCCVPLFPEAPCIHGLVYREDIAGPALDFLRFLQEQIPERGSLSPNNE